MRHRLLLVGGDTRPIACLPDAETLAICIANVIIGPKRRVARERRFRRRNADLNRLGVFYCFFAENSPRNESFSSETHLLRRVQPNT